MGCKYFILTRKSLILPLGSFKWVEEGSQFNEDFIKSYNKDSDERYFFKVDVQYHENLHKLQNDLTFLPQIMNIEEVGKLVANLNDKKECYTYNNFQTSNKLH